MGSTSGKETLLSTPDTTSTSIQDIEPFDLVAELDVQLLKGDWALLKGDAERVGVITYLRLFETHPEVKDTFLQFQRLSTEELEYSRILKAHALRVMALVDKSINRLDDTKRFQDLITHLGVRHGSYKNVKMDLIDLIGPQFILAIKPKLKIVWNDTHENTWNNLFKILSLLMKKGMTSTY